MKSYQQICGIAKALDVIGDRWTLLILRDLLLGPLHYQELFENLRGITSNMLADRLRQLQDQGLVEKVGTELRAAYRLTAAGTTVEPILFALGRWGWERLDTKDPKAARNLRWALVSVKRRLRSLGRDFSLVLASHDQGTYTIWEKNAVIHVEGGPTKGADCTLQGPAQALLQALVTRQEAPWMQGKVEASGTLALWPDFLQHLSD